MSAATHEGLEWRCTWCGAPSHAPEEDELITCPTCGTNGALPVSQADGYAENAMANAISEFDRIIAEDRARGTQFHPDYFRTYPNGCPILPESND